MSQIQLGMIKNIPAYPIKAKAFTLAEMLVVMILLSLIILLGFIVVNLTFSEAGITMKGIENYRKAEESVYLMYSDAESAGCIIAIDSTLHFINHRSDTTFVSFTKDCFIRTHGGVSDTFNLILSGYSVFMNDAPVEKGMINRIVFETNTNGLPAKVVIEKWYDAKTLLDNINYMQ
jgi:prepilin-type N-terminal cleavage/methylation domain-containing protein